MSKNQPADHQPKKPKVVELENGDRKVTFYDRNLTVVVQVAALDDFELLDKLASMEKRPAEVPGVIRQAIGDDQFDTVMDALRDKKTGRVSIVAGTEFFRDLFGALNPKS